MQWYEDDVADAIARRESAVSNQFPAGPVVFYGSSSIRLWQTLEQDFPHTWTANLGFGGSTLEACDHFFERMVLPARPSGLVVYAGDNDIGDGRTPEAILKSFHSLMKQIDADLPGVPVAWIGIKPSIARWEMRQAIGKVNAWTREAVRARPGTDWVDIHDRMLGSDGKPRKELFADDGLHLSPAGYQLWAQAVRDDVAWLSQPANANPV
ncbi:MAG: SGNH/GDSL hydrolase family protein [Planctomycetota bacterium]